MGNLHSYSGSTDGPMPSAPSANPVPTALRMPAASSAKTTETVDAALREALGHVMAPMAALCLARGLTFAVVEEMFKHAFVEAARAAQPASTGHRDISRVSAATGLTRREVTRISQEVHARAALRPSPATQIFTRWVGNRRLHDKNGLPRPLKRQGRSPSFEALAQSVTRDVHPRTLLEELCRLGLAQLDETSDTVSLVRDSFVPRQDQARMFGFLGNNVGDHMAAAVANILSASPPHVEQAVFADELSAESLAVVHRLVAKEWKSVLTALVPQLEALIDADAKAGRRADRRVRIGMYEYHARMSTNEPEEH